MAAAATTEVSRHATITAHVAAVLARLPAHDAVLSAVAMRDGAYASEALDALLGKAHHPSHICFFAPTPRLPGPRFRRQLTYSIDVMCLLFLMFQISM